MSKKDKEDLSNVLDRKIQTYLEPLNDRANIADALNKFSNTLHTLEESIASVENNVEKIHIEINGTKASRGLADRINKLEVSDKNFRGKLVIAASVAASFLAGIVTFAYEYIKNKK